MAQITCQNLSLGYDGNTIIKDINFEVNEGDYLCIVGKNGTGKSTLMKSILGLKNLISGKILLGDGLARNEIGYLTQQSQIQKDFPATVREIVLSGCQSRCGFCPYYNKYEKVLASSAMQKMDIIHLSKRCYRELSGGQQQRVLLSRALCATQKILFLDEPITGLDSKVVAQFYSVIEQLNKNDGITIVMISHDIKTSIQYASHILYIGKTMFWGTKEDYLKNKEDFLFLNKEGGG